MLIAPVDKKATRAGDLHFILHVKTQANPLLLKTGTLKNRELQPSASPKIFSQSFSQALFDASLMQG